MTATQTRALTRAEKWQRFYEHVAKWSARTDLVPAYVQEPVKGLWCVSVLCWPAPPKFGWVSQTFRDPPSPALWEPFYNGYPGDHRGWMRFESAEAARDFYRYSSGKISYEEFRSLKHSPYSGARIDLDDDGNFVPSGGEILPRR